MVYGRVYRDVIASVGDRGGCPILNTAVEADDTNIPLQLSVAKALFSWKKNIVGIIEKGAEAGEFRQKDARLAAECYMHAGVCLCHPQLVAKTAAPDDVMTPEALIEFAIQALR